MLAACYVSDGLTDSVSTLFGTSEAEVNVLEAGDKPCLWQWGLDSLPPAQQVLRALLAA